MKKTMRISCVVGLGMLFAAMIARANTNTVSLEWIGYTGNGSGGEITYPYYFYITGGVPSGGTNIYNLLCDSLYNKIYLDESWNAYTLTGNNLSASTVAHLEFPSAGVTGYLEGLYLFGEERAAYTNSNSDSAGLYNWAAWDLFAGGLSNSVWDLSSSEQSTVSNYLSAAEKLGSGGSLTPSEFSNDIIYTPTDMGSGGPQEFFGYGTPIPEPGTLALVAFGLGLAGALRRKVVR